MFSTVGIENLTTKASKTDSILEWYTAMNEFTSNSPDSVPLEALKRRLDNLVERRNQVTHRGGNPEDLIGVDEMRETADFIVGFTRSLYTVTVASLLKLSHVASTKAKSLTIVENPKKDGYVVIIAKPLFRIAKNQPAFGLAGTWGARWGRILEIRVNDSSVPSVEASDSAEEVGLQLDFQCTKGTDLYLLSEEDSAVWESAKSI